MWKNDSVVGDYKCDQFSQVKVCTERDVDCVVSLQISCRLCLPPIEKKKDRRTVLHAVMMLLDWLLCVFFFIRKYALYNILCHWIAEYCNYPTVTTVSTVTRVSSTFTTGIIVTILCYFIFRFVVLVVFNDRDFHIAVLTAVGVVDGFLKYSLLVVMYADTIMRSEYKLACRNRFWQLLNRYPALMLNFIWFTDDKPLTFYHFRHKKCPKRSLSHRDVHESFWTETRPETHVSETETRRCSFRDAGRDLEAPETLESLESFNVSPRRFPWRMGKHINNEKNYTD